MPSCFTKNVPALISNHKTPYIHIECGVSLSYNTKQQSIFPYKPSPCRSGRENDKPNANNYKDGEKHC
ncbi:hypothetical protein Barb4_02316 [Bacteroidales bacterium Barb4]|nr:hypothetical protein Barb4_02316 [Bacteroidales bacterium Barb4]